MADRDELAKALAHAIEFRGSIVCPRKCEMCDVLDHHWDYDEDSDPDNPRVACRHCDASREMTDQDCCEHEDCTEDILTGTATCNLCGFCF